MTTIIVNGVKREIQAPTDTLLLYVLKNDLELTSPQFGCGLAQCGACSVLLNGNYPCGTTRRNSNEERELNSMIANREKLANTVSDVFGAALSRRGFVKAGGALIVGFGLARANGMQSAGEAGTGNTLDAGLPQSWIEVHPDNTILIRVGKPDFGQGTVF